ncbi:cell division protein SepF [Nocardioides sp. ChNu-153]|uniref:cell division protein SepF n=1 Tax=unclassified Nocardioides TaxID=2615069 RepID=UPI002405A2AA|nr:MULTISPECIES: cell division protein SepF [unclassified Nocardioides]MDF9716563.1 cell division protein SepF [Nocardioides sp. ChNu-99]MDN7120904.1 cell division protein SepF [Nocardioides sp. ChNu-153]
MSGAMRKIGEYLGLLEDPGYDEYDEAEGHTGERDVRDERDHRDQRDHRDHSDEREERPVRRRPVEAAPAPVADLAERRRAQVAAAPVSQVAELSRIITLHPRTYNEARTVGENFRDGIPVIMNLSEMDDSDAKRLVDFAAGLVFATRGTIERVTNKVFLLSPPNVTVAAEDKARIVSGGFFNQS